MPDPACPRCGVPLHDQPDYCWSCGFYVGDRWRTPQIPEGDGPEPRLVAPGAAVPDVRVVGDGADPPRSQVGMDRWLVRLAAVAALVIIGLLALALFGGR